jgi:hypothetical protein
MPDVGLIIFRDRQQITARRAVHVEPTTTITFSYEMDVAKMLSLAGGYGNDT